MANSDMANTAFIRMSARSSEASASIYTILAARRPDSSDEVCTTRASIDVLENAADVASPLLRARDMTFRLTTPAFEPGTDIPSHFTCDGADCSPALVWTNPPHGTESFALIMEDPDAPRGTWVHWVLYDLPASERELPGGVEALDTLPSGARQGINDFNRIGYGGPCPPPVLRTGITSDCMHSARASIFHHGRHGQRSIVPCGAMSRPRPRLSAAISAAPRVDAWTCTKRNAHRFSGCEIALA